jgi:Fe2+ or Zn2+ uptake regulation protein
VLNDYDPDLWSLNDITAEVTHEIGFEIMAHRLDFFGICDDRKMKEKPTKIQNKEA